jgi:hypothetical protein
MSRATAEVRCWAHDRSACERVQGPATFTESRSVPSAWPEHQLSVGQGRASSTQASWPSIEAHRVRCHAKYPTLVTQALRAKNARHSCASPLLFEAAEHRASKGRLTRMQMQIQGSAFPLRSPAVPRGIRLALVEPCEQPANPSIERTSQGLRPCAASHVKR